jgi:hypothetical protein
MNQDEIDSRLPLWRFVRGDDPVRVFEPWAYRESTLEARLGPELYFDLIATNFRDAEAVWSLRDRLGAYLRSLSGPACFCVRMRDVDIVGMGSSGARVPASEKDREWSGAGVMDSLREIAKRGELYWWLWSARCSACDQAWLVGSEERVHGIWCLRRMDDAELRAIQDEGRWPDDFDSYERLILIGGWGGCTVSFFDPRDASLESTLTELALARPRITISELAMLLNIGTDRAVELARRAVANAGAKITFDSGPAQ